MFLTHIIHIYIDLVKVRAYTSMSRAILLAVVAVDDSNLVLFNGFLGNTDLFSRRHRRELYELGNLIFTLDIP